MKKFISVIMWGVKVSGIAVQFHISCMKITTQEETVTRIPLIQLSRDQETVFISNLATGRTFHAHFGARISGMEFIFDSKILLVRSADKRVSVLDIATEKTLLEGQFTATIIGIEFISTSKTLIIKSNDGVAHFFDLTTGQKLLRVTQTALKAKVVKVFLNADKGMVVIESADEIAHIFDVTTGKELLQVRYEESTAKIMNVKLVVDTGILVIESDDGLTHLWNTITQEQLEV